MDCKSFNKLTITLLALIFFVVLISPGAKAEELVGADSWVSDEGIFEVIEDIMMLEGDTGSAVFNKGIDMNETIVFDAVFSFNNREDSWIAFKLRSDKPGLPLWKNDSTYFFLIRNNGISAGRVTEGKPVEYLIEQSNSVLSDGKSHEIEIGVINQGEQSIPRLIFKVDGRKIIEYDDFTADNRQKFLNSNFSVDVFQGGRVEIETLPDPEKTYGEKTVREFSYVDMRSLDSYDEKWAVVQHIGPGELQYYKTGFERNDSSLVLAGPGSLVYKDRISADSISFDLEMTEHQEDRTGMATVLIFKSERDSYFGDDSFGFSFGSDGRIVPVAYSAADERKYPGFFTGVDFSKKRNVKIEWAADEGSMTFFLYIDSSDYAYKYEIEDGGVLQAGQGFLGVLNNSLSTTIEISGIEYNGESEDYISSGGVMPVYLQDYMNEEGESLLHWEYRADEQSYYKVVVTDTDDLVVGEVHYPDNVFHLPDESIYEHLFIKALNIDGTESEKVMVNLEKNGLPDDGDTTERIIIKPDNAYGAKFIKSESKTDFFVNGFNYIRLRFGDHSTFEPPTGILNADYDPYSAESMFRLLKEYDYNTVRIFVSNGRTTGNQGTAGDYNSLSKISAGYMDNITDFLTRAQNNGIYVLVCFGENDVPDNQYFRSMVPYSNQQDFLFNEKFMEAKLEYISLFLNHIKNHDASLLKTILAVQEQNEFSYNPHTEPFSTIEGSYIFHGNNKAYDMGDADSRRALANDALQHYISNVRRTMDEIDPRILLTIGTSTLGLTGVTYPEEKGIFPDKPNNHPLTAAEYLETEIDFLDIHSYNFTDSNQKGRDVIDRDMESMLLNSEDSIEYRKTKPVILGEYGSVKGIQDTFDSAKLYIIEQRNTAVKNNFKGALLWTFDAFSQNELFSAMEDNGNFIMQLSMFKPFDSLIHREKDSKALFLRLLILFIVILTAAVAIWLYLKGNKGNAGKTKEVLATDGTGYPYVCNFFGEFEIYYKGRHLTDRIFLSVKARDLLIYMLNEKRAVSKDEIIEAIWRDKENSDPNNLFHVTLYKLRKSLRSVDGSREYIECRNRRYTIEPDLFMCIHEQFAADLEELLGKDELTEEELETAQRHINCYKNKYLYSYDYEWAYVKREYYHGLYERILLISAGNYVDQSRYVHALMNLNLLLKSNPYCEDAYIMMLSIHKKQGNKKEAENIYESYLNLLSEELGVGPSEKFEAFYYNICNN